jgi:hypothetical protein
MTGYKPSYIVARNGTDLIDAVVDEVNIIFGRQDVQDQPNPATMTLRCYSNVGTNLNFKLNDQIEFFIDDIRQFVGYITQVDITMTAGETGKNIAYYDLSLAAPLAFLSRTNAANTPFPVQGDVTRITELLFRAFSLLWKDLGLIRWRNYPINFQWQDFQPAYPFATSPSISGTNVYTLSALPASDIDTLTLAQMAASSARGVLYDSRDGQITYDNYTERLTPTLEIEINGDMVLTDSIRSTMSSGDLVNVVTIQYTGGSASSSGQYSIETYGPRAASKSTELHLFADAKRQAQDYVQARSVPKYSIKSFTVPLHLDAITAEMRGDLLSLSLNTAVTWPANLLPKPLTQGAEAINYVEGWELRANENSIFLTIITSPRSYTYGAKMWLELETDTPLTWATYPTSEKWKDA